MNQPELRSDCRCCGAAIEGSGQCRVCFEPRPTLPQSVVPLMCSKCAVPVSPGASFCPKCFKRPRFHNLDIGIAFLLLFVVIATVVGIYLYHGWNIKELPRSWWRWAMLGLFPIAYGIGWLGERALRGKTW